MAIIFGKKVVKVVCAYAPQFGRAMSEKEKFYEKKARGCEVGNENEVLICLEDFNGHIGKEFEGFEGVHESFGGITLEFCVKGVCVWVKIGLRRKLLLIEGVVGQR